MSWEEAVGRESPGLPYDAPIGTVYRVSITDPGTSFTIDDAKAMIGRRPMFAGTFDWRVTAAQLGYQGELVTIDLTRDNNPRAEAPGAPKKVHERLAKLELDIAEMREDLRRTNRRIDATINIAARDAVERIRKELARVVNRF